MIFKTLAVSDDRSHVSHLSHSGGRNVLFAFTESGDTYSITEIPDNAYGYGDTWIYGAILDGLGWEWIINPLSLRLEKKNRVMSYEPEDFTVAATGEAYGTNGKAKGVAKYISDVLSVGDEFGFWKTISWSQDTAGERVVIAVKTGETSDEVVKKDWERYFEVPTSYYGYPSGDIASIDLDRFNLKGSHFMFKIEMETTVSSSKPSVRDLIVSYAAKHSVFFFTNKIKIESDGFNEMILTASSTLPSRTEIAFGVGPGNSVDWHEYETVDLGRIQNIPDSFADRSRVGIRMTSFDTVNVPVVHEFALEFSADGDNEINEEGLS